MKIYLIRHGEVSHNVLKQFSDKDEDLNEIGVIQANEIKKIIKDINYDLIISSPLLRAKHTANIINVAGKPVLLENRIIERTVGNLNGQTFDAANRNEYWNYFTNIQYGTSENIKSFFNRVYDFIEELKTKKYNCVLIVTHSGVSKVFNAYFNGIGNGLFLKKGLKNCEIKEYDL